MTTNGDKSLESFQDQILRLSQSVDNLEMRSRRKILLLHGVPKEKQEDTAEVLRTLSKQSLNLMTLK
ncbi:hypothetical protein K1T71_007888 [Dendrolimus kikuchii]|uniref:Uncharacterized protein n=1 Tax=Dendrolimus kikuchii TaxID=765133 RepID=A0ACC1CZ14_9NEOP|nr:hypothetical protein K1T71_007888 [Dendrolimus kikuchii]